MKYLRNIEADGVLERLLKAEMGRASRDGAPCSQFDPDFSTAYIERNLTPGETSRYEVHLAACSNCRIQVASLARSGYQAALAEPTPAAASRFLEVQPRPKAESGVSRVWGYLLQPQWIAVSTAALVLLVAVPIFFILKNAKQPGASRAEVSAKAGVSPAGPQSSDGRLDPQSPGKAPGLVDNAGTGGVAESGEHNGLLAERSGRVGDPSPEAAGGSESVWRYVEAQPAPPTAGPPEASSQKNEADSRQAEPVSQTTQLAQNSPQQQKTLEKPNVTAAEAGQGGEGGQARERQQDKTQSPASASQDHKETAKKTQQTTASDQISPKEAQTLPDDDKKPGVSVLRSAAGSPEGTRAKDGKANIIRPTDSEPPKTESNRDEAERRVIASRPARESTKGKTDAEPVRKQPTSQLLARGQKLERRVEGKRFRLQAGIWTDREFKPDKEIPAVTLIRDGELYKSALDKQPGLRGFLAGFTPDERVIVVYKNIIYKVFPHKD